MPPQVDQILDWCQIEAIDSKNNRLRFPLGTPMATIIERDDKSRIIEIHTPVQFDSATALINGARFVFVQHTDDGWPLIPYDHGPTPQFTMITGAIDSMGEEPPTIELSSDANKLGIPFLDIKSVSTSIPQAYEIDLSLRNASAHAKSIESEK